MVDAGRVQRGDAGRRSVPDVYRKQAELAHMPRLMGVGVEMVGKIQPTEEQQRNGKSNVKTAAHPAITSLDRAGRY